jgi:hypothetical protein
MPMQREQRRENQDCTVERLWHNSSFNDETEVAETWEA